MDKSMTWRTDIFHCRRLSRTERGLGDAKFYLGREETSSLG